MPKPIVAVVGRPNVGKSTLVNRISQRPEAIVHEVEGVTRDRTFHESDWNGVPFMLCDTGGIEVGASEDAFQGKIREQAVIAIQEADTVVFLVDSKTGVTEEDDERTCDYLAEKAANLRIFEDDAGKMNRSLLDTGGEMLVVSQFTLCADCKKGRRPAFVHAARPERAIPLYERFLAQVRGMGIPTAEGRFGADMLVSLENDGPVTIVIDTDEWKR